MNQTLRKYRIRTPENVVGEVMGKLTHLGAWLGDGSDDDGVKNISGLVTFAARVPDENINEFKEWFVAASEGRGEIEEYT